MHTTPARRLGQAPRLRICALHTEILGDTLPQPNQRGNANHKRHPEGASAIAIRRARTAVRRRKEHAQAHEQIAQHFRIRRQRIGKQYVSKLAVGGLGDAANANTLQRRQRPAAARARDKGQRCDEAHDEDDKVQVRQNFPGGNVCRAAAGQGPEQEERECEGNGEEGGDAVGGEVVGEVVRRGARGVADQRGDVDAD